MKKIMLASLLLAQTLIAQEDKSFVYQPPQDPLVQAKLAAWQGLKFGLLMHWGTYSQWGIVESWSICPEDVGWTKRKGPYADNYFEYVKAYEHLQYTFNPVKFDPDKWAAAAKDAGMKYVIFTTKHHDGFCMFDTHETDYSVTSPRTPFSTNPKANIAKEIFNSFRKNGLMTGAYFSKPDWHSNDYWWRYFPPKDRNPSYDPKKYPERWNDFKDFTYRQIRELMSEYGKMDILWLDGGWVRPHNTIDKSVDWQRDIPYDQDIDMPKIAAMARSFQPGLLVVDRTVHGPYENYVTPEQQIPDHYLPYPWESCITMGNSWSYVPNDHYKTPRKIIQILTDIVSRNGNLLLNVGPAPDGTWDPAVYDRLKSIGEWMRINGEAIYHTKADPALPKQGQWVFTRKEHTVYAIYQVADDEKTNGDFMIQLPFLVQANSIHMLGGKEDIAIRSSGNAISFHVNMPDKTQPAWVFAIPE